jgi:hypothetical protein
MGELRQHLASLFFADDEATRTPFENLFKAWVRRIAREESDRPVQVVEELPATAPAGALFRTTTSRDLFMGNGASQPLSRFIAVP